MSSALAEKLAALHRLVPVREEHVDEFLQLIAELVDLGDPAAIPELLAVLDDHCPLVGVMDAVARNLEEFPPDAYVPRLLNSLPALHEKAPFLCENEIKKYLWALEFRNVLLAHLPAASAGSKQTLRAILDAIESKVPKLSDACKQVRGSLGS